jgi:inosine-uridine nucleoside N-ribohydrolase
VKKTLIMLFTFYLFSSLLFAQPRNRVWLDADTGNEMDDLYAIARLLIDSTVDVVGLSSAHFNNVDLLTEKTWNGYPTKNINTVKISQSLNEMLLKILKKTNIPHPIGAHKIIGRAWGGSEPVESPAARALISEAHKTPHGQLLDVISIGALSNLASAIILDSTIIPKIRCFMLGAKYATDTKAWDKSEFNIRNDLNAFDYILNKKGLDLTIMPTNIAFSLQFQRDICKKKLNPSIKLFDLLYKRWDIVTKGNTWVMWDLALIEAYLSPRLATLVTHQTPLENTQRNVEVYTKIDAKEMESIFWKLLVKRVKD